MKRRLQPRDTASQQAPRPVDSPYLTSQEAIVYLRLNTLSALYSHMRDNRLPYLRAGRLLRFDKRELDAWLAGHDSHLALVRAGGRPSGQSQKAR